MASALDKISYGLYVTGVKDEKWFGGCVIDAFMQISRNPNRVAYCSMKKNRTSALLKEKTEFSVSVLPSDVHPFVISNFGFQSSSDIDKWKNVKHDIIDGLPYLTDVAAKYRCVVESSMDVDSHYLFVCEVIMDEKEDKNPLIYDDYKKNMKADAARHFMEFKKSGKSPLL